MLTVRLLLSASLLTVVLSEATSAQPSNLGVGINSPARDAEPTFTPDGNTMYFNCFGRDGGSGNDICVAYRDGEGWTEPEVVAAVSTEEYQEVEPLLSPDASQLFIMSNRPGGKGGGDIWVSDRVDGEWTTPRNLEGPWNTPYQDHCIYFWGEDWEFAYWTSTRPDGLGGNDIWMSERVDGVWQPARNLGPSVNSAGHEHHSLPSEDGRSLYITANREDSLGQQDIYVTTRDEAGNWSSLTNLGPAVNSAAHDRCPAFSPDFEYFFFDSEREGGVGDKDLWVLPYSGIEHIR